MSAADHVFLARLRSDESVQRLLASRARGSSPEQARSWVERMQADARAIFFVIADVTSDEPLGYVQLTEMDAVSRHAMFGICIAPAQQGRGIGGDTLTLVEAYARRVWNLRKLVLHVLAANAPAVALYRRVGYRDVGTLSGHFCYDGAFEDVVVMEHVLE